MPAVPQHLFDEIYRRHGHRCPMSTLGGRLGFAARRHLAGVGDERLLAIYRIRTCALDGIAVTAGCSAERGNLLVREEGRHALDLLEKESGMGVEVALSPAALAIAWEYRLASESLDGDRSRLAEAELAQRERHRDEVLERVLMRLRGEADSLLLEMRPSLWIWIPSSESRHA